MYEKKNKDARDKCRWTPPPSGWSKLNFDGALRGNPGIERIRYIINSDSDKWITKRYNFIGSNINNLVELEALQEGLQMCQNLSISKLISKGDSQIILNAIRKMETPNKVLNSKLKEIL